MHSIKVGIIGATGYTGFELIRLLLQHPYVELVALSSRNLIGEKISKHLPHLEGLLGLHFCSLEDEIFTNLDLVFYATPHTVAMGSVAKLLDCNVKVIDLGADFRLKDIAIWEQWYGVTHSEPYLAKQAVYGLCEYNRGQIKQANLIANPGCYPTSIQLGLLPLLELDLVDLDNIIIDSKSGISGAGRNAKIDLLSAETSENFIAYGASGHRHLPEIEQGLRNILQDNQHDASELSIQFCPHLAPMIRGIESSIYVSLKQNLSEIEIYEIYKKRFAKEYFIQLMPMGNMPSTRMVKGTNFCKIGLAKTKNTKGKISNRLLISSTIDNLIKGAAGQAIQNMNLRFGFSEQLGIQQLPLVP